MGSTTESNSPTDKASPKVKKLSFYKRMQALFAQIVGISLIHLIGKTTRFVVRGRDIVDEARGAESLPVIIALFHGPHFPVLYYCKGSGACIVTSRSADGQILTNVLHKMGYQTVRGSSSRGGVRATIELARTVQRGGDAAVAVDGPKGPALKVKPGIVLLAKITGRPIIPVAPGTKTYWRFQSWDRFRLPFPFNRALLVVGDAVYVPEDADDQKIEHIRAELELKMNQMQDDVDAELKSWIARLPDRKPRDKVYEKQRRQQQMKDKKSQSDTSSEQQGQEAS